MLITRKKKRPDTKELLLEEHILRGRCVGDTDIEWYMPFVILGGNLHETERKALWKDVYGFVSKVERNHFHKRFQINKEYTDQRVLLFYELCSWKWDKSIRWCCANFISCFPNYECILMLRRWGVGNVRIQDCTSWQIKAVVIYLSLYRYKKTYEEFYIDKYKRPCTNKSLNTWEWKSRWVENLINEHLLTQFIEGVRSECADEAHWSDEVLSVADGEDVV